MKESDSLYIIGGPTASGKTQLAIQLAKKLNTVIVSADSRQLYYEMNIGVAKPSLDELAAATHYFINHTSIHNPYSAGMYAKEVRALLPVLFEKNPNVIVAGGTGFYIKALLEGLDDFPKDEVLRTKLQDILRTQGIEGLQSYFRLLDNKTQHIDLQNPQRLIRYIELVEIFQKPLEGIFQENTKNRQIRYPFKAFYLNPDRSVLYEKINQRVNEMMKLGLLEEVKNLYNWRYLPTLQTVGYTELFEYLDGTVSLDQAIENIKRNTRRYAKRQLTWFRNQPYFQPIESVDDIFI